MERYLENVGTRLWSTCAGEGTPLLMCNGGPGCDDYLGAVAEMLCDICTVARFEPRGCGRSDYDGRYDLDTTVSDIEFVRREYGFGPSIVLGHSAGVGVGIAYALRYPRSVLGIVGIAGGPMFVNDRGWSAAYHVNRESRGEDAGKVFVSDPEVNRIGVATWREFITAPTLLRDLALLDVPVTLINGGDDIRPNWPTQQIACLLPKGLYVEIHGAAHFIWLSRPDELRAELRAAVNRILAGSVGTPADVPAEDSTP